MKGSRPAAGRGKKAQKQKQKQIVKKEVKADIGNYLRGFPGVERRSTESVARGISGGILNGLSVQQREALVASIRQAIAFVGNELVPAPRLNPKRVMLWSEKLVYPLQYLQTGTASGDPRPGFTGFLMFKNPSQPLWAWQIGPAVGSNQNISINYQRDSLSGGLIPINGGLQDSGNTLGYNQMTQNVGYTISGMAEWAFQEGVPTPTVMFYNASSQTYASGVAFENGWAAGSTITLAVTQAVPFPTGTNFSMRCCSTKLDTGWIAGTALGSGNINYTSSFAMSLQSVLGRFTTCLPDAPLGIQIMCTTTTVIPSAIEISTNASTADQVCFISPVPVPQFSQVNGQALTHCCIGAKALSKYTGPTIYNGGSVVEFYYTGGDTPFEAGICGYTSAETTADFKLGALDHGAYQTIDFLDEGDFTFKQIGDVISSLSLPSIQSWFNISNPTNSGAGTNAITLHMELNFEGTTTAQTRGTVMPVLNWSGQQRLVAAVASFPRNLENPTHMEDIEDFFKQLAGHTVQAVSGAVNFYNDNKGWLDPLLVALEVSFAL